MKFEEINTSRVKIYNNCLVYFLIDNDEVVYVGQTRNGLARPFSHRDKIFNRLEIIECDEDELDLIENTYISKYNPIYNNSLNHSISYGLPRSRNEIRKNTAHKNYCVRKLKKDLIKLGIEIRFDKLSGNGYIHIDELNQLINYLNESDNYE